MSYNHSSRFRTNAAVNTPGGADMIWMEPETHGTQVTSLPPLLPDNGRLQRSTDKSSALARLDELR